MQVPVLVSPTEPSIVANDQPALGLYLHHRRSRRIQFSNSLRLQLFTTRELIGLLIELERMVSIGLPHIPVKVELVMLLAIQVQPHPLFLSGMVAL